MNIQSKRFIFLRPKDVYMVARPAVYKRHFPPNYYNTQIYSAPFYNAKEEWQHVHVSFAHFEHAQAMATHLKGFVFPQRCEDALYYSNMTHTPLVIIDGGECDLETKKEIYSLHFHKPRYHRTLVGFGNKWGL